jgi:hypothetical protein
LPLRSFKDLWCIDGIFAKMNEAVVSLLF